MSELFLLGCIACVATVGLIVAFAPLRYALATKVAALLVPVLIACDVVVFRVAAFCASVCEPADAVGELDLWMAGLIVYGGCSTAICAMRAATWLLAKSGRNHALPARHIVG
jgi:uncharacterized membrane protein YkvI